MALLFMDGFAHYGTGRYDSAAIGHMTDGIYAEASGRLATLADGVPPRTGIASFQFTSFNDLFTIIRKVLFTPKSEIGTGLAYYFPALPSSDPAPIMAWCDENNNIHCIAFLDTTGSVKVYRYDVDLPAVLIAQTGAVITAHAWHHLEFVIQFHNSNGYIGIAHNNDILTEVSGIRTNAIGRPVNCQQLRIRALDAGISADTYQPAIADWFIRDGENVTGRNYSGFLGDRQAILCTTSANGADQEWAKNVGDAAFDILNNIPPEDTKYIYSDATTESETSVFALTDLPPEITNVAGLMTVVRAWKSDAGVAKIQVAMVSGGDEDPGADRSITTAPTYWMDISEKNPDTNSAWTPTTVNAADIRVTRTL